MASRRRIVSTAEDSAVNPSEGTPPYTISETVIEFSYTPATFLEAPINQRRSDYELELADGLVKASLVAVQDPMPESLVAKVRSDADTILGARQLLIHESFFLAERPRTVQVRSDGKSNITVHTGAAALTYTRFRMGRCSVGKGRAMLRSHQSRYAA